MKGLTAKTEQTMVSAEWLQQVQNGEADASVELALLAVQELQRERMLRMDAEAKLEQQRSKVLFAEAVSSGHNSILVGEMANILKQNGIEIGQTRLFEWLRANGYLYRQPCGDNRPTQKSLELGVMEVKARVIVQPDGRNNVSRTVKITPNGQLYFMEVLNRHRDEINEKELRKKQERNRRETERRRMKRLEAKQTGA